MIALHEGREALLVAAIAMLYLRRTDRLYLICAIRTELAMAMAMGYVLSRVGAISPTAEGVMALLATAAVTPCVMRDA